MNSFIPKPVFADTRSRLLSLVRHWHYACILILQRGGRHLVAETDFAANQFGALDSVKPARHISVLVGVCPSHICRIL